MLKLGCIADDFGDGRELACRLIAGGMQVVQTVGVPRGPLCAEADAAVVSIRTRHASPRDAVVRALDALVWLKTQGARQFYFCFSPTFDSLFTGDERGNIGPVIEALMNALGTDFSVVVPSFPDRGHVMLKGYLFAGSVLLQESAMARHPQTPMTDSNLVRVLQAQTRHQVTLVDHVAVNAGSVPIQERLVELRLEELSLALLDAGTNDDLQHIAQAVKNLPLINGSPGLGTALCGNFDLEPSRPTVLPPASGLRAVICGSCAEASERQVQHFHAAGHPAMALDPLKIAKFGVDKVTQAVMTWAQPLLPQGPVLLYTTADAQAVEAVNQLLGTEQAQATIDQCLVHIASGLLKLGVRQLVISGSDTAQACLRGLGIRQMQVGLQVEDGVPWCYSAVSPQAPEGLHLVMKPGTAGQEDFFTHAFDGMR